MRRLWCVLFALGLIVTLSPVTALASSAALHLEVGGVTNGDVFAVNQQFEAWPAWVGGTPDYVGGSLEYLWSPEDLVVSRAGTGAIFKVPERLDSFEFFVSAETTGLGAWVSPSDLSARIGGATVVIAGLSDADSPHVNYTDERPVQRTLKAGEKFTLTAQWRNASGAQTKERPSNVHYVWSCKEESAARVEIDGSGLTAAVTAQHPGRYEYVCSCYDASYHLLCEAAFPVTVTGNESHEIDIVCDPPADHGVVRVSEGDTAHLVAKLDPAPQRPAVYTWQRLNEEGLWENAAGENEATLVYDAAHLAVGTTQEFRCLARTGSWAGVTPVLYVEVTDPEISFEQNPFDICAAAGAEASPVMIAAVSHPDNLIVTANWQYRANASSRWEDAAEIVPEFRADAPQALSGTLTLFSWTATGDSGAQNGEYRCVSNGTSSSPALLMIVPESADGLTVKSPLTVKTGQKLGTLLTGLDAPNANSPLTVSDLTAMVTPSVSLSARVAQQTRIMASDETVGTGCQMQIVDRSGTVLEGGLLVLRGDVNGTGVMGLSQLVRLSQALRDESAMPLLGPYLLAGDFDGNEAIDLSDLVGLAELMIQEGALGAAVAG